MYQSTAKQQQKLCICTGVFYTFKKKKRKSTGKENPDRCKTILDAINFVNNHKNICFNYHMLLQRHSLVL